MQRVITVVDHQNQSRKSFNVENITTFGELKAKMVEEGFNLDNKEVFEGISRLKFIDENSLLPTNLQFKDKITNDLVILLTPLNIPIKSGMTERQLLYSKIKKYDLQNFIKEEEGRNFTQVSSELLSEYISDHESNLVVSKEEQKTQELIDNLEACFRELEEKTLQVRAKMVAAMLNTLIEEATKVSIELSEYLRSTSNLTTLEGSKECPYSDEDLDFILLR